MNTVSDTNLGFTYKHAFWLLLAVLIFNASFGDFFEFGSDADEVVLKRQLPQGDWLYITRYGAMVTDMDTLRFFISKPLDGNDADLLKKLNKGGEFLITDSALENVVIQETPDGVAITLKGAVYLYFSEEYVTEGDQLRSYRITLTQLGSATRD